MRFADIVTDVEKRIGNTSISTVVKQWVNQAQDEIQAFFNHPFLITEGFLQTVDDYSTGTAGVTNGSSAITGAATVWASTMIGRKIRIVSDNEWYTIIAVGGVGAITLDRNYEGTTDATANYVIYQDTYRVLADVNRMKLIRNLGQSLTLQYANTTEFDMAIPSVTNESSPRVAIIKGRDNTEYATGTVSGATNTITGAGTSWTSVQGLSKGNKIQVGNYSYTIKSVDSALQVTTYETLAETVALGTSYKIQLNNMLVQLYPPPAESIGMPYKYYRTMKPLVNNADESEVPEKYHRLLVEGACKRAFIFSYNAEKFNLAKSEFNEGLLLMKKDYDLTSDRVNVMRSDTSSRKKDIYSIPRNFGTL